MSVYVDIDLWWMPHYVVKFSVEKKYYRDFFCEIVSKHSCLLHVEKEIFLKYKLHFNTQNKKCVHVSTVDCIHINISYALLTCWSFKIQ